MITLASSLSASDEQSEQEVKMEISKKSQSQTGTQLGRTIFNIPDIDVKYYVGANIIEISCQEDFAAEVYIYDSNGNIVDYINTINTSIQLPNEGQYTIYINSEHWYALGHIN